MESQAKKTNEIKNQNKKKYRIQGMVIWIFMAFFFIGVMAGTGFSVWDRYKDSIIKKQEEQMLIIADSLADNLEEWIMQCQNDLSSLSYLLQNIDESDLLSDKQKLDYKEEYLTQYMETELFCIKNAGVWDADGEVIWEYEPVEYSNTFNQYKMANSIIMTEKQGSSGLIYFILEKKLENGKRVKIVLDLKRYYEKRIANIRVGTNGYIVVKNENEILFMHPVEEQIGKSAITGREELYQGVDLKSLQEMFQKQNESKSGVQEYYSYWWENPSLQRVKKISAFSHVKVGDHFLVVSAVMDYSDVYDPIVSGFRTITITIGGIMIILMILAGFFAYFEVQSRKNKNEIIYLKNLNQMLEETKRGEEALAHQQRLQIMGTMTGGIAHEFNNLLTPIMGYSEMLMELLSNESEEYDYAHEIFDASEKAKDIIHQISGLSRKNMETVYSFIEIRKALTRAIKMVRSICPSNVRLTVNHEFSNEGFLGNETQINQVILNICVNAFHAIGKKEDGKLTISGKTIRREEIEKKHGIYIDEVWNHFLCICIQDNGCGMDRNTLEQIFNPFFTTKAVGKGTGLGLSVAEQIVHSHKGLLLATSQEGEGSSFYIYLHQAKMSRVASEEQKEKRKTGDMSILVLDDNGKIRKMLEHKFRRLGIRVETVQDPKEASDELKRHSYSVLLIDQELSVSGSDDTGIRYAMTLHTAYPDLIKIIMTEQVRREIVEAKQCGYIDGYLEKPVSDTQVIETIYQIKNSMM